MWTKSKLRRSREQAFQQNLDGIAINWYCTGRKSVVFLPAGISSGTIMRLSDLKTGERGIIVKVSGHGSFRKRITEMGFIKGKEVRVVLNAPLKDPIEYEIIGYKISLRREEAEEIEVISESEARAQEAAETAKTAVSGNADTSDAGHAAMHDAVAESDAGSDNLSRNETGCGDAEALDRKMRELAEERRHIVRVALVGNPNCGKTSLTAARPPCSMSPPAHTSMSAITAVSQLTQKRGILNIKATSSYWWTCPAPTPCRPTVPKSCMSVRT